MAEYAEKSQDMLPLYSTTGKQYMNLADIAFAEWVRATNAERERDYRMYRDYYEGEHPTMLTTRLQKFLQKTNTDLTFRANYMAIPVDILAERLQVIGFHAHGEPEEVTAEKKQGGADGRLWQWWVANRMDEEQGNVHVSGVRDGDTFELVEWDNEEQVPRFHHHLAFDGSSGVGVNYDDSDKRKIVSAFKQWRIESGPEMGEQRRNIYLPDRVIKQISGGPTGWREVDDIPWVDVDRNPLGVPIFHFRNNGGGYDYGRSELADLVPIQNALNKSIIDLIAAADAHGFPQFTYKSGPDEMVVQPPEGIKYGPGGLLFGAGDWGVLNPGDIGQLMDLVRDTVTRMAQISRTPLQYYQITGQVASADTQQAGDTGLVSKIENRSVSFGNTWEDIMYYGRKLHNTFGSGPALDLLPISTEWSSFERVDRQQADKTTAETQSIKAATFDSLQMIFPTGDKKVLALLSGYNEEEADIIADLGQRVIVSGIEL